MIQDNCDWYILPESAITRIHKTLQSRGFDERLEKLVLAYIYHIYLENHGMINLF